MVDYVLVFVGAGIGGSLRFGAGSLCARYCGIAFPWGTLFINVVGSTIMGLVAGYLATRMQASWAQPARLLAMTGVLGGFTTFSAFSLDAVSLWERGAPMQSTGYVVASVAMSIAGLVAGLAAARALS